MPGESPVGFVEAELPGAVSQVRLVVGSSTALVAFAAVPVQHRPDVAGKTDGGVFPGRRRDGARLIDQSDSCRLIVGRRLCDSWQPRQPRRSPGITPVKLRIVCSAR